MKTAMLLVAWCCTMGAWAYDFEANGIYYGITSTADKTVEVVVGETQYSGDVTIPATVAYDGITYRVTTIGDYAFGDCSSLTSITLPESLTSIGEYVFQFCSSLASIVIPEGVTSIEDGTFSCCSSLASITFPESLTSTGENAFQLCSNLQKIHSLAITPPTCKSDCFWDVDKSACTLYVPKGALEAYKAADEWKDFVNIVEEEYTGIEEVGADRAGQAVITACGDGIVVENLPAGTAVTVYTLSGTVVYEGVASGSRTELTLPAGHLYLVKCGPTVTKVAL